MIETTDIDELKSLIHSLRAEIQRLMARVKEVETENAELRARLAQNSANSSKPPASDGYQKKTIIKPALPKLPGKKPGGQPGHPGKTLEMVEQPDTVQRHQATHCQQCGLLLTGEGQIVARRQVFDLPQPRLFVEEHQLISHQCACGCTQTGQFPDLATAPVQYGPRIHAHSILLNVDYRVAFEKIKTFWAELLGYAYNGATLHTAQSNAFEQLQPIEEQTKAHLIKALVCHFDETGIRVAGKLHWLHVASNGQYTHLFVHPKRGKDALTSPQSIFEECLNWTVHDCWSSYFSAGKGRHSLCGAHLLRELTALVEQGCQWAGAIHGYLLRAYQATRCGPLPPAEQARWLSEYEQLCQQADEEEPAVLIFLRADGSPVPARRGRPKQSKGRNLLNRFVEHRLAVLAFAFEEGVPFTNNQAERDLRPVKVKQKVSNCFRTEAGAACYARISGFISTMRKNSLNVVEQLTNVLSGSFTWAT